MNDSWVVRPESYADMFSFLRAREGGPLARGFSEDILEGVPEEIRRSLSMWILLYDVPFQYLVVREEALPEESIRFFHLDESYLFALLDGAMSVGRSFDVDYQHDADIIDAVITQSLKDRYAVRPGLQGKSAAEIQRSMAGPEPPVHRDTGFLLRSALVCGWRGLEFRAYGKDGAVLRALRLETLGPEVLLGIYRGEINRLEIAQPPEGLHYGFTQRSPGKYEKRLRRLDDGSLYQDDAHMAQVVMRNADRRVVDFHRTGESIRQALDLPAVTSAHIALEMIQNPLTGVVERE